MKRGVHIMETIDIIVDLKKRMTETQFVVFYLKTTKDIEFNSISDILGISTERVKYAYATSLKVVKKLRLTYKLQEDLYRDVKKA